jgi:aspartate-semialdehyde dehydrogenase
VAGEVEIAFAEAGVPVFSNARNHRMAPDVPLVVPNVNGDHMDVVRHQKWFSRGGFIVTNANCSTTGLTIALKPLVDAFGIESAVVVTMQAISGAGYPGVPSLDILDNVRRGLQPQHSCFPYAVCCHLQVVPYISGEEDKLETEYKKILGSVSSRGATHFVPLDFPLTAHANRWVVFMLALHGLCPDLIISQRHGSRRSHPVRISQAEENCYRGGC